MNLSDIQLGYADGRKEAKIESYQSMFYEDDVTYGKLKKDESIFIISGHKGVGKTLLSRYFIDECQKKNLSLCQTISLKDIQSTYLKEFENVSIKNEEYSIYLKFCILLEVAKLLINEKKTVKLKLKDEIKYRYYRKKLKKIVKERYPESNFNSKKIQRTTNEDTGVQLQGKKTGVNLSQNTKTTEDLVKSRYFDISDILERLILKCIEYQSIIVLTDDIDEINEIEISNKNFRRFLLCYISVCENLNEIFVKKSHSRCLVIVRNDILNSLNSLSSNINKTIADGVITINWMESKPNYPWEYKIAKMILRKIRNSVKEFENSTDEEIYCKVFPTEINSDDTFHYLITYSYGRPREIIYWLNTIIDEHGDASSFEEQFFFEAMVKYSTHLLGDLKNEMSFYFDSAYIDELFELLTEMDKKIFKLQNVQFFYENNINSFSNIISAEKAIKDLYEFGVIGNKIEHNQVSKTIWAFRSAGKRKIKINEKFTVHLGLRKALLTS